MIGSESHSSEKIDSRRADASWKEVAHPTRRRCPGPPQVLLVGPEARSRCCFLAALAVVFLVVAASCQTRDDGDLEPGGAQAPTGNVQTSHDSEPVDPPQGTTALAWVDLTLTEVGVSVASLPLRAGFPFTVTATIQNNSDVPAIGIPVLVHISALQEQIGYTPFTQVLSVTLPSTHTVAMEVPVRWNLAGGEHQLWVQVNRLPEAWWTQWPPQPEIDRSDNSSLVALMVDPFDAYTSDLCPGRVDASIDERLVQVSPEQSALAIRVHNEGNQAMYNLPVVVTGDRIGGIAYTPAIPPCGGTAEVTIPLDRLATPGESLHIQLNPAQWAASILEDNYSNNVVTTTVALRTMSPPEAAPVDYDFSIATTDIQTPELWIVMVTVHNLGTRDASTVPILVENESGRKITDFIPLVQGEGIGQAAIRVGYLWTHGGTLSFTINPQNAKGAYPEKDRSNNSAQFTLP